MASGGEPFQDPLYLAPNGSYLDAAGYQAAVGLPPSQGPFMVPSLPTLSPWYAQYTTSSGSRLPIVQQRGIASCGFNPRTRVIGDVSGAGRHRLQLLIAATSRFPGQS